MSAKTLRPFCRFSIVAVLWAASFAQAQYDPPAGYYNTATGTGATLKTQLNAIIDQHTVISYSNRAAPLKDLDKDPANPSNVLLIYSGYSVAASQFPSGTANTEHLWVQTYGIDNDATAYGDLFNLRPSDVDVNSARADKYYDNGGTLPADAEAPLCRTDSDSWEPRDADKGDIARAMFYMDTRYEGDSNDGLSRNLILTDNTALITTSNNYMGKLSALIEWNYLDPVSTEERARNHKIFTTYQHNRNPFVDHPEYVWAIYGSAPNNSRLYFGATSPADGASSVDLNYRLIKGAAAPAQSITLNKTGTNPTTYNVTASGAAVSSSAANAQCFPGGTATRTIQVALDSTATVGLRSGTVTIDNTDLTSAGAGFGSADGNDVINLTAAVLEHANASFCPSADQNALALDFGNRTALTGPQTLTFSIYNLGTVPAYTAALDIDTVNATGHTAVLSSDLAPSLNLPAGQARTFTATLNTNTVGTYQTVVTIGVSDENISGATAGTALTMTLKANIVAAIVAPDLNADGHVDSDDYDLFAACFTGPNVPLDGSNCSAADFDGDTDVDLADFARFQRCFTGPARPPFPDCAG